MNVKFLPPKQLTILKFKMAPLFWGLTMSYSKTLHHPNNGGGRHRQKPWRRVCRIVMKNYAHIFEPVSSLGTITNICISVCIYFAF